MGQVEEGMRYPVLFFLSKAFSVLGVLSIFGALIYWLGDYVEFKFVIPVISGGLITMLLGLIGSVVVDIEENQRDLMRELRPPVEEQYEQEDD